LVPRNPRPELRDKRKREILEAAAAVFADRGFRTARIADIAARAGIGKGTVYEYFRSKEDLFITLFDWYLNQIFASVSNELDISDKSIADALTRSSEVLLLSCDRMRPFYPLTMEFWAASSAPAFKERLAEEFKQLYRRFRGALAETIRLGVERGELGSHVIPEAVAAVLVSAYDGLFLQAWFDPSFDPVESGRHFFEITIRGMMPAKLPGVPAGDGSEP
jgi:AcrR family transcriptional regulator